MTSAAGLKTSFHASFQTEPGKKAGDDSRWRFSGKEVEEKRKAAEAFKKVDADSNLKALESQTSFTARYLEPTELQIVKWIESISREVFCRGSEIYKSDSIDLDAKEPSLLEIALDKIFKDMCDHLCPKERYPLTHAHYVKECLKEKGVILEDYVLLNYSTIPSDPIDFLSAKIYVMGLHILNDVVGGDPEWPPNFFEYPHLNESDRKTWISKVYPECPGCEEAQEDILKLDFRSYIDATTYTAASLTEMGLSGNLIPGQYVRSVLALSPNLEELTLGSIAPNAIGGSYFRLQLNECRKKKEKLELTDKLQEVIDQAMANMLAPLVKLKKLTIVDCSWFTIQTLYAIGAACPQIEHIVNDEIVLDDKIMEQVRKYFPNLKSINGAIRCYTIVKDPTGRITQQPDLSIAFNRMHLKTI